MIASEEHILGIIDRLFPNKHAFLQLGRGDDCAVWRALGPLCVSTDLFLEDVHFRRSYFKPEEVGHKALAVNISDIAAMGSRPLAFTLALGVPPYAELDWLEGFFSGMASLANHHRMALVGGDLSRAPQWHVCITAWGEPVSSGANAVPNTTGLVNTSMASTSMAGTSMPGTGLSGACMAGASLGGAGLAGAGGGGTGRGGTSFAGGRSYLTRGGAMPGDILFLVGQPGLARVGLAVLEELGHEARTLWPAACAAHLKPLPHVDAGLTIARAGATSRPPVLMDVSDGLARDLPRLLGMTGNTGNDAASPLGAQVLLPEGLLPAEVIRYARQHDLCPVTEAWNGGEDYALLGACVPDILPALHAALPALISIGTVTEGGGICCNAEAMPVGGGFDHFGG